MTHLEQIIRERSKPALSKPPRKPITAIVFGVFVLALGIAALVVLSRSGSLLDAEYLGTYREAAQENASDYGAALIEIRGIIDSQFNPDVDKAVDELTGFGAAFKLTYCMAKDKLTGSDDTRDRIDSVLYRHFSGPAIETMKAVEAEMQNFANKLVQNSTSMGVKAGLNATYDDEFARFHILIENSRENLRRIALSSTLSQTALAMTAAMSPTILAQARNVLGAIVRRVANTQAASAICVVADGPFPVGDAIALGLETVGTSLAIYDLHKARKVLRENVRPALREGIAAYREALYHQSMEIARKMIADADTANRNILKQISR
jgi:hypothetical protein